jgi:hypothetical protein
MLDERVHITEGRLEGREPIRGPLRNIEENLHTISDSPHPARVVFTSPLSPPPGHDRIGSRDLVTPGLTSCPTTKCEGLRNQPRKNCERFTSIYVNFDPLGHPRLSKHPYRFFLVLLDKSE